MTTNCRQMWSLGMELAFYLLLPWLAGLRSRWLVVLTLASAGARCLAVAVGMPDNPWQIRFTPFELYFFVLGVLAYRAWASPRGAMLHARRTGLVASLALLIVTLGGRWPTPDSRRFPRSR